MPVESVPFGPGTVTIGTAPMSIDCEVLGGSITHAYESVGESRTMMCATERPASELRKDGVTLSLENDLTTAGVYAYLYSHDLETSALSYVPNTPNGAAWAGNVQLKLPPDIGAAEFGAPIVSTVTWAAVGLLDFTPGTAAAADPATAPTEDTPAPAEDMATV